jgi:hypothetical protein
VRTGVVVTLEQTLAVRHLYIDDLFGGQTETEVRNVAAIVLTCDQALEEGVDRTW